MNKTICFDFDGVIATYNGWKGFDVLGEPIQETISCMRTLKDEGWYIVVFTTRQATPILIDWLTKNKVPFDDINRNGHNPLGTSIKPIYKVIVDDRAVRYQGQSAGFLYLEIKELIREQNKTDGQNK